MGAPLEDVEALGAWEGWVTALEAWGAWEPWEGWVMALEAVGMEA